MQLANLIEIYNNLSVKERKIVLKNICENSDISNVLNLAHGDLRRSATRILADLGKNATDTVVNYKNDIIKLLNSNDPKVRINTAKIIGNTVPSLFLDNLISSIEKEETMFVLPSFISAIGAAKNESAKNYLDSYKLKSTVEKHRHDEKESLNRAKANFIVREKVRPKILTTDIIMVTAPNLDVAHDDFSKAGIKSKITNDYLILTKLNSYQDLFKVRSFSNAYIYLGSTETNNLPQLIKKRENAVFQRTGVTNYRLEIKGISHEKRVQLIMETKKLNDILINTPSAYSIELFVDINEDKARLFLNPLTDTRFSYRKESVPASITGENAASVCAFASEYFKSDSRVLDNFCGSGTMLFERGFYKYGSLTGVDINLDALKAAQKNSQFVNDNAKFIHMDALKFTANKFDEIITNMPFGLRVGSHSQNERLYRHYVEMLPSILVNNGIAVLYTHEKKLLEKLLKSQPKLKLLKKVTFEAGGLNPAAYILQKHN